jgi:hypothetical protein
MSLYIAGSAELYRSWIKLVEIINKCFSMLAGNDYGLAKNWYLKFVQPGTAVKFIIKSLLFYNAAPILAAGVFVILFTCQVV